MSLAQLRSQADLWASECDLMACLAGLVLETRFGDWHGMPFDFTSSQHISVWRKP
jgi:hypothetical protein